MDTEGKLASCSLGLGGGFEAPPALSPRPEEVTGQQRHSAELQKPSARVAKKHERRVPQALEIAEIQRPPWKIKCPTKEAPNGINFPGPTFMSYYKKLKNYFCGNVALPVHLFRRY